MSSTMKFYCLYVMFMSSRTNLAWLPERQVWATQIICINPRWPPDAILKNHLVTIYHRMLCNISLKGFSSMENSFLMLFLHYHVPEYPNPRWPPDAILKIQQFDCFLRMLCNMYL